MTQPAHSSRVTFLGHSTVLLELDGARLLTDPILSDRVGPLRRHALPVPRPIVEGVDAVLVSHLHWDHLHLPSLRLIPGEPLLVVPRGAARPLGRRGFRRVEEIDPGETVEVGGLRVSGTFAEHGGWTPMAPRADAVGFLVRGTTTTYFAGDTDLFEGMERLVGEDETIDLALVPIHWGALYPVGLPWRRPLALRDAPRHFVERAGVVAPRVDVRVLEPGESLDLPG